MQRVARMDVMVCPQCKSAGLHSKMVATWMVAACPPGRAPSRWACVPNASGPWLCRFPGFYLPGRNTPGVKRSQGAVQLTHQYNSLNRA